MYSTTQRWAGSDRTAAALARQRPATGELESWSRRGSANRGTSPRLLESFAGEPQGRLRPFCSLQHTDCVFHADHQPDCRVLLSSFTRPRPFSRKPRLRLSMPLSLPSAVASKRWMLSRGRFDPERTQSQNARSLAARLIRLAFPAPYSDNFRGIEINGPAPQIWPKSVSQCETMTRTARPGRSASPLRLRARLSRRHQQDSSIVPAIPELTTCVVLADR
jgi:hypothetical protein